MHQPARRLSFLSAVIAAVTLATASLAPGAQARAQGLYNQPKYAAIVVDAATGEVLYARRADQPRYPASITKVMTLYLVFEALATGRLSLTDRVVLSRHAANQAPSKSGLRAGDSLSVDEAIRVTALKSANDLAVALGEKVAGSESRFAALMTLRAQELGMTNTRFVNANGLPDTRQITTARDIAILSRAVMRDYPQYYSYFGQKTYQFRGQRLSNHNHLLNSMPGVDGIKTGYINASGFNLAASAVRDGKRLITVVLGGQSTASRDDNVEDLLNAGFEVLAKRKLGENFTVAAAMREPEESFGPATRGATEMGSGEENGLRVVVADNDLRTPPTAPAVPDMKQWLGAGATPSTAPPPPSAGLKAATLALSDSAAEAAVRTECVKVNEKVRLKATRRHKARTVTRTKTVCHPAGQEPVQAAKAKAAVQAAAADCDKPAPRARTAKARAAQHRATEACKRETVAAAQKAGLKGKADAGGGYRVQVGAFDSKSAAEKHLDKLSKRYAGVLSQASSQVQSASHGAYRARFNGFSAQGAKAVCAALEAKGEGCLVLAPG
jgi:D-alanyl-D-alanine carboxypeptidase (penicillin-binding protein 5/6)